MNYVTSRRFQRHAATRSSCPFVRRIALVALGSIVLASSHTRLYGSDHGDGHMGDFYAFRSGGNLVMAMTVAAAIPEDPESFVFSSEFSYHFLIDVDSQVDFSDPEDRKLFGGKVVAPESIREDIEIEVRFPAADNKPQIKSTGLKFLSGSSSTSLAVYSGVRDEPFIRRTVIGKNIAAIVVEVPLQSLGIDPAKSDRVLLLWAETRNNRGVMHDLCGRSYRSQQPDQLELNKTHPSEHLSKLGLRTDVLIYNTKSAVLFPNGRKLDDDVVDILGLQDALPNEKPSPSENDVPFLAAFPYLAPPHNKDHEHFEEHAPKEPVGMLRRELGRFDLGRELAGMGGRDVRLRFWLMSPGGTIQFHKHAERPAMVYLLTGEVEEYKWGIEGKQIIKAGQVTREAADTEHYWVNNGAEAVFMAAVDLVDSSQEAMATPETMPLPKADFDVSESEREARKTAPLSEFKVLESIDLRDTVPLLPNAYSYAMRAREVVVKPGHMVPVQRHNGRPGITYVVSGVVVEHRDDRPNAVPLRTGDFTLNAQGVTRWLINKADKDVKLFEVDFFDAAVAVADETSASTPQAPLVTEGRVQLNYAGAQLVLAAAKKKAEELDLKLNVAVVDEGGHLLAFLRMDGARPASAYTAMTKAVSAATFRQATGPLLLNGQPDVLLNVSLQNAAFASGGKVTTLKGGLPLLVRSQVVGAIGVSGGAPDQDVEVATAGCDALVNALKP